MIDKINLLFKKELSDWLYSIKTYIFIALYLGLSGYMINRYITIQNSTSIENVMPNLMLLFIFFIPLMCLTSVRKERKTGMYRLIVSSPTTAYELLASKFASIYAICLGALAINCLQFLLVRAIDVISLRILISTFFGYALLLPSLIAMSFFFVSLTNNEYINYTIAVITFVVLIVASYFYIYVPNFIMPFYAFFSIFTDMKEYWLVGRANIYPFLHTMTVVGINMYFAAKMIRKRWQDE